MSKVDELIELIREEPSVYIQTHDFPDHDAVASAYALRYLLRRRNVLTQLVYAGGLQGESVQRLIAEVHIPIRPAEPQAMKPTDKIIIVDGCKGSQNVTDLPGEEIGVIDHHELASCERTPFSDTRPDCGSCSTIVFGYYRDLEIEMPGSVATALLTGLLVDTGLMTRRVSREDVVAYSALYPAADVHFVNSVLRNKIQKKDLGFYRRALDSVRIQDRFAFHYFSEGCNQNLLGIIGDFFLSLREVNFVVLCARNDGNINFSVRSEEPAWNAAVIIQEILKGIGFGGGHSDMAGGIIPDVDRFDEEEIFRRIYLALHRTPPPPYTSED